MTPDEIVLVRHKIKQQHVDALVEYLDNWMKANHQPDKDLKGMLTNMKKDKCQPYLQTRLILGCIYDWLAYGN